MLNERACRSLSIYPDGNEKEGGKDHVSIDLVLVDTSSLPLDWEINAIVNFSAYNFIHDEYYVTQGTVGAEYISISLTCLVKSFNI